MNNTSPIKTELLTAFSQKDFQSVQQLVEKLGATFQILTTKEFKSILASSTTSLFVARDTNTQALVGMATLAVYRIPYLKKAYLDDFIVDDSYQGKGIGSQLIHTILTTAKKQGAAYIEFTSNPKRVGANKFYQKMGFEKRDTNVYRLAF